MQVQASRQLRQQERERQQHENALLRHRQAQEAQREAAAKVRGGPQPLPAELHA